MVFKVVLVLVFYIGVVFLSNLTSCFVWTYVADGILLVILCGFGIFFALL